MAGLTEGRGPEGGDDDDFWSWRQLMYRFLDRGGPDEIEAITALAFAGDAGGRLHPRRRVPLSAQRPCRGGLCRPGRADRADRGGGGSDRRRPDLCCRSSTLMPGLAVEPPSQGQRRFITDLDGFADLVARGRTLTAGLEDAVVGVAPHSLRAVSPEELAAMPALAGRRSDPHPCRGADEGGRRLPRVVGRPAGRMAARQRSRRSALVPDPRDPRHPDRMGRGRCAGRGGRPVPGHRGQSRRRRLPGFRLCAGRRAVRHRHGFQRPDRSGRGPADAGVQPAAVAAKARRHGRCRRTTGRALFDRALCRRGPGDRQTRRSGRRSERRHRRSSTPRGSPLKAGRATPYWTAGSSVAATAFGDPLRLAARQAGRGRRPSHRPRRH
jgi:hypothetical protein